MFQDVYNLKLFGSFINTHLVWSFVEIPVKEMNEHILPFFSQAVCSDVQFCVWMVWYSWSKHKKIYAWSHTLV